MAKNRRRQGTSTPQHPTKYTTSEGQDVDSTGHTPEFMDTLNDHIDSWLLGVYNSTNITYNMSSEEIDYMVQHQQSTANDSTVPTGHLTRMERVHHFTEANLKEGDTLKGNNLYRSFSKDPEATTKFLGIHTAMGINSNEFVFYRTVGDTPFFDPTKFSNPFPWQNEVFVPMDTMKVDKIHTVDNTKDFIKLTGIGGIVPEGSTVTVVDIKPDSSVKSVGLETNEGNITVPVR